MNDPKKEGRRMPKEFWLFCLGIVIAQSIVVGGLGFLFASEINVGVWIKDGWHTYNKRVFDAEQAISTTKDSTDKLVNESAALVYNMNKLMTQLTEMERKLAGRMKDNHAEWLWYAEFGEMKYSYRVKAREE